MATPFDDSFKNFGTHRENGKARRKIKGWLLTRQYLQKLEEPEEPPEKERNFDISLKNKLRCVLRSAFYGMKEGVLAGVFIGGFYGIFKFLNGSTSSFFGDTPEEGSNYGGGIPQGRKTASRSRRVDTRPYHPLVGRRQSRSSSISYQEKYSGYKTIEETIYGFKREAKHGNVFVTNRGKHSDVIQSRLPVRTKRFLESLNPKVENKKRQSFEKSNERIEIIGYALVKTTGAFESESTGSRGTDNSKESLQKLGENEEENEDDDEDDMKKRTSADSTGTHKSRRTPVEQTRNESNASPAKEKSARSIKREESEKMENRETVSRSTKSVEEEFRKEGDPIPTIKSEYAGSITNSGEESLITGHFVDDVRDSIESQRSDGYTDSKSKSRQSEGNYDNDEQRFKPSRITIISPKRTSEERERNAEYCSSVLIKSLEPDQSEISTQATAELSQDSRSRTKESVREQSKYSLKIPAVAESATRSPNESVKSSKANIKSKSRNRSENDGVGSRRSENIYPKSNRPSYLANADEIENGFVSPSAILNNEQKASEHEAIQNKYSESIFSPELEGSRADFDDVGYTGSNISEFQMRSHESSLSATASLIGEGKPAKSSSAWSEVEQEAKAPSKETASVATALESKMAVKALKQSKSTESRNASDTEEADLSEVSSTYAAEKTASEPQKSYESTVYSHSRVASANYSSSERSRHTSPYSKAYSDSQEPKSSYPDVTAKSTSGFSQAARAESRVRCAESKLKSAESKQKSDVVAYKKQKTIADQEESDNLALFSSLADNTILLCACNCALVLGIVCTVISTTRASLKI